MWGGEVLDKVPALAITRWTEPLYLMFLRTLALSLLLAISLISATQAAVVKTLKWQDLVPKFETALVDPLGALEQHRRVEIENAISAQRFSEQEPGMDEFNTGHGDSELYSKMLREQGHDLDALARDYQAWKIAVEERNNQVVKGLDGQKIKMAGYLLPLEFSEEGVREFLLVPYVGACIHVPAPPANQIVLVTLKQSYKVDGLYEPVWVTGTMSTKPARKALSFVDGSAHVPSGYTLAASVVEAYEE